MDFAIRIQSGIELMDFTNIPALNDNDLINHELNLIETEVSVLMRELEAIEHAKMNTEDMFRVMSLRTLGFGIFGAVVLILANAALYYEFRKTLRDYKIA